MKKLIDPQTSKRGKAFALWMHSPMPMVTLTKTMDITRLVKYSKKHHLKLNMLLCWCIGQAARQIEEFYTLPEKGQLFHFDELAINVIVVNKEGGINSCDIPITESLTDFNARYLELTAKVASTCQSSFLPDYMIVGTSALVETELDSIINQYTADFSNPMVLWAKYRKDWFHYLLPLSFQFHHVQMDGREGARFLETLQLLLKKFK